MSFWESSLGHVTGNEDDAFAKQFTRIPDNSELLAVIKDFEISEFNNSKHLEVTWQIAGSEFNGQLVRQKIRCWDHDEKKRFRALNMFRLFYKIFNVQPQNREPTPVDLNPFIGRKAGIKVQETEMNDEGKQYNWVSEVHSSEGFKVVIGTPRVCELPQVVKSNDNFEMQHFSNKPSDPYDDVPF